MDEISKWHWGFQLHLENIFNARSNFFLVAQSFLLIFYATVAGRSPQDNLLVALSLVLGISFALAWLLLGHKSFSEIGFISRINAAQIESYKTILNYRRSDQLSNLTANSILAYYLPLLTIFIWGLIIYSRLS